MSVINSSARKGQSNNLSPNQPHQCHKHKVAIDYVSENAVLLQWPQLICPIQHRHIIACQQAICQHLSPHVIDVIVSFASLMVYYRFDEMPHNKFDTSLRRIIDNTPQVDNTAKNSISKFVEIPVYYGNEAAWDMGHVAKALSLSAAEIITQHSQAIYRAYALGFTPGFCYLGALSPKLHLPRMGSPRIAVPHGAVAIAEQQTAVYPTVSPGGWHIIGQTPLPMFTIINEGEFLPTINVGDEVKFTPINKKEFLALGGEITLEKTRQ